MWWRMWQTYETTTSQMMMKARMMTWMMETPLPIHKPKKYPSYPHASGRMGAMAIDSSIGVEVFCCCLCFVFPQPWQMSVCFCCVCAFFGVFFGSLVCVCVFLSK